MRAVGAGNTIRKRHLTMATGSAEATARGDTRASALRQLRNAPRLALIVGVSVAVSILAALLLWARSPDFAVLYSGLSGPTGGAIVARLEQDKVPYKLSAGGSVVQVPRAQVDRLRLQLASDGLPRDGVGFELMDNTPFGISEFAEKMNYRRALGGELARSIETMDAVAQARVQLALPDPTVFVRERLSPTASVVLRLNRGGGLTRDQVAAIQHLVASAVAGLPADAVTVVDERGHLLSRDDDAAGSEGVSRVQLTYIEQVQESYRKRVQRVLEPIVGAGNLRTQVTADMNFARQVTTQEAYAPNHPGRPAAIRSEQRSGGQATAADAGIGGIPGALSNQPSPEQPSPINAPLPPDDAADAADAQANAAPAVAAAATEWPQTGEHIVNYELNRTLVQTDQPVGNVQRISVAVLLNQSASNLGPQELQRVRALIEGAVGYQVERGDIVQLMQAPFAPIAEDAGQRMDWWRDPGLQALALQTFKYLLVLLVAWLLWRRLVWPLLQHSHLLLSPLPARDAVRPLAGELDDEGAAEAERALTEHRREHQKKTVQGVQQAARDDPRMVAMVVRNWMKEV